MALAFKNLFSVLLAAIFGILGLVLIFSDIGQGEAWQGRVVVAALFFFFCGFGVGLFNPQFWAISGLAAWAGILFGGFLVFVAFRKYGSSAFAAQEPPYISSGLILLFFPVTFSLIGGYVGKLIGQRVASLGSSSPKF